MMSKQSIILISLSAILGVYILGSALLSLWRGTPSQQEYNIGCYVVQHSLNRSQLVVSQIASLQHQESMSRMASELQPLPLVDPAALQNSSIQLALSFEKFIKKFTQQHDYNMENVQIYRQVAKAEKEYLACKAVVDLAYSEADCNRNWQQYLNCSSRMDKMSLKLQRLAEEEKAIRRDVAQAIQMPNSSISGLQLAKRDYNESLKINERNKNELNDQLASIEKKRGLRIFQRDEAVEKYQLTFKNLRECQQNKKKHDACEQISKQVRNINSENIAYLKVMMESKEELLKSLQRILASQKNSKEVEELNDKYLKHKEEYIVMLKEFISLTRENEKACGCTPELEADLKSELERLRTRETLLNVEIRDLNLLISDITARISRYDEEREEIVRKYRDMLEKKQREPPTESELSRANRSIRQKYQEILDLQSVYANIEGECEAIKARMGKRVHEIGAINDCLSKKNYFLELKRQTAQYIHSDNDELNRILESKRELAHFLRTIGPQ